MDYRALASQIAQQEGVPVDLFLRLVNQESRFNPNAVSSAGAMGLAQLMPGTARDLGVDPNDPVQNLTGGARYLRQQLDTFGQPDLALAAYNAGPGNVRKHGGIPPFKETQNYVSTILGAPAMQGRTSTRGSQPMAQPMTPTQQAPQGILEMMGIQKRDPSAQDQTALPFYQRDQFKNTMGNIAMAANTLRQRPDDNITAQVQSNRQQRDIEQRSSRTAQWLSQQPGGEVFVEYLNAGADPAAVLQAYQKAVSTKPDQTAAMQNYAEYQRILAAEGPEAAKEFLAMSRSGNSIQIGGDPVALDAGLRTSLYDNLGEEFAAYTTAGASAAANIADLNILQELTPMAPEGQIPGRIAQAFPGLNDISAVRDSIIKRVAPTLRVEGSGSTSDVEYAGMIQSLGSLTNSREANQAIISVMQAKAQYNIARAAIVRKLTLGGGYTTERALADIDALEQQQNIPSQVRSIFAMAGVAQSGPQGGGPKPTPAAIDYLVANPNSATEFDLKFGDGAAASVLGKQ